jgi:hypothetical protein
MIMNCNKAKADEEKICNSEYEYIANDFSYIRDISVNVKP